MDKLQNVYSKNEYGSIEDIESREQIINQTYTTYLDSCNLADYASIDTPDPFVKVYANALTDDFCDYVIDLFHKNTELQSKGLTRNTDSSPTKVDYKKTTDMQLDQFDDEQNHLNHISTSYISSYLHELESKFELNIFSSLTTTGYQVQMYKKNDGRYFSHHDFAIDIINNEASFRVITFIYYLNDVEDGGETILPHFKITPKKGSLLLFPASWNYIHSGNIPKSSDKYIITGWFYGSGNYNMGNYYVNTVINEGENEK